MEIKHRFAKRVRVLRADRGWSQEQLADQTGLHRTYISQIERAVTNPTIETVEKFAEALNVTCGQLLDR